MTRYVVTYRYVCVDRWEVEADSPAEAVERVLSDAALTPDTKVIERGPHCAVVDED